MVTLSLFLTLAYFISSTASESIASFTGKEYVQYQNIDALFENQNDKITLRFKTTEVNGILLYACDREVGNFLMLEIKKGKIVYTGYFDSEIPSQIILDEQSNDNNWHDVTLIRGAHAYLTVDNVTKSRKAKFNLDQLELDTYLYIGGFGDSQRSDTSCHSNVNKKNFIGCLSDVLFNDVDLLHGAREKYKHFVTYGKLLFSCPTNRYEFFGLHTEASVLNIKRNIANTNELNFAIELRTFEHRGHIATVKCTNGSFDLDLTSGKVRLTLSFSKLSVDTVRIESPAKFDDGDWHVLKVSVRRDENIIILAFDNMKRVYRFKSHFQFEQNIGSFKSIIQFGGNTANFPGLVSCIRKLDVDSKIITYKSKDIKFKHKVINHCQIRDVCFPNPCQHGSRCIQSRQRATCICKNTDYQGKRCEICIHKRTCQELKKAGEKINGFYKICPQNIRVFRAYCNMATGATIIKHDINNDTLVNDGTFIGSSTVSFYFHHIHYDVPQEAITDLMSVSTACQQYIRYDCYNSRLLFDVGKYRYVHFKGARWVSRDSVIQHYWGGATPQSRKCGCGMDGSCAKDSRGITKDCNCDIGDKRWRYDAGLLRGKNTLPVTQVQFSMGPETYENSFFTVGELKCFGTIPKPNPQKLIKRAKN